jgi:hypothetical protein
LGDRRYSSIAWCGTGGRIKSGHDDVSDAVGVTAFVKRRGDVPDAVDVTAVWKAPG